MIQFFQNIGTKIGSFLNKYMKSYGCPWIEWGHPYVHSVWPRRWMVQMLGSMLREIDTEEFLSWKNKVFVAQRKE